MPRHVQPLPPAVAMRLRAGPVAVDVAQCVEELVMNAVDAGAQRVAIEVDLERFSVTVEDDGSGIAYADLQKLGQPNHTSKAASWDQLRLAATFGFRGEALAALQQIGVLSLTTRDPETGITWTKAMHQGRTVALQAAGAAGQRRSSGGTLVQLQDIFGTLPVRRRCLVPQVELQRIKLRVAAVALACPEVAVSLKDAQHGAWLLRTLGKVAMPAAATIPGSAPSSAAGAHRSASTFASSSSVAPRSAAMSASSSSFAARRSASTSFSLAADLKRPATAAYEVMDLALGSDAGTPSLSFVFGRIFGVERVRSLRPVQHWENGVSLHGYIGVTSHWTPELQFLTINGRPVSDTVFHAALTSCFGKSLLCLSDSETVDDEGLRVKRRKRVSRYAVYVLNLRVPPELCDPTLEPTKKTVVLDDEEIVVALVIRIIEEFLRQHQLWCGPAAADGDRPSIVGQNATGYMAEERENLAFDSQHNGTVDGGMSNAAPLSPTLARQLEALARPTPATPPTAPQPATRHSPTGHQRLSNHLTRTPAVLSGGTVNGGGGGMAACSRVIQRRSVSSRPCPQVTDNNAGDLGRRSTRSSSAMSVAKRLTQPLQSLASSRPAWQRQPAAPEASVARETTPLPAELQVDEGLLATIKWRHGHTDCCDDDEQSRNPHHACRTPLDQLEDISTVIDGRSALGRARELKFERQQVAELQFVGQVDKKFLACMLPTGPATAMLVMVDQHAAHERVLLEELEERYLLTDATGRRIARDGLVEPPYSVNLGVDGVAKAQTFQQQLQDWGIALRITGCDTVELTRLPLAFLSSEQDAQRPFSTRPEVVVDFVKQRLEILSSTLGGGQWALPSTLHDVLCTRACHAAVKFGDALSRAQCLQLLEKLAACKLPFQCAHGRPSIAPLVETGTLE